MYTRWPSCLALFIADTKNPVALQAGVLQQADMRPVYREVQKCRAENVVRAQHSSADYFTLTSQSMKTDQRFFEMYTNYILNT